MNMIQDPKYAFIWGAILAILFFVIQLALCLKTKNRVAKSLPAYFVGMGLIPCLLVYVGVFGVGDSGVLAGMNHLVAALFAIPLAFATGGILLAWVVFKLICSIQSKKK